MTRPPRKSIPVMANDGISPPTIKKLPTKQSTTPPPKAPPTKKK